MSPERRSFGGIVLSVKVKQTLAIQNSSRGNYKTQHVKQKHSYSSTSESEPGIRNSLNKAETRDFLY